MPVPYPLRSRGRSLHSAASSVPWRSSPTGSVSLRYRRRNDGPRRASRSSPCGNVIPPALVDRATPSVPHPTDKQHVLPSLRAKPPETPLPRWRWARLPWRSRPCAVPTRQATNKAITLLSRDSAKMPTMIAENLVANRRRILSVLQRQTIDAVATRLGGRLSGLQSRARRRSVERPETPH